MASLILTVSALGICGRVSRPYILEVHQLAFHSRCNAGFGLLNTFSQLPIISPNKTGADCMISFSLQVFLFQKTCFKCNTKGPNEVKRLIFQIKNRPGMGYSTQEMQRFIVGVESQSLKRPSSTLLGLAKKDQAASLPSGHRQHSYYVITKS